MDIYFVLSLIIVWATIFALLIIFIRQAERKIIINRKIERQMRLLAERDNEQALAKLEAKRLVRERARDRRIAQGKPPIVRTKKVTLN